VGSVKFIEAMRRRSRWTMIRGLVVGVQGGRGRFSSGEPQ
jgi:hypothetical protein